MIYNLGGWGLSCDRRGEYSCVWLQSSVQMSLRWPGRQRSLPTELLLCVKNCPHITLHRIHPALVFLLQATSLELSML